MRKPSFMSKLTISFWAILMLASYILGRILVTTTTGAIAVTSLFVVGMILVFVSEANYNKHQALRYMYLGVETFMEALGQASKHVTKVIKRAEKEAMRPKNTLRKVRRSLGLTQKQLAERAGRTQSGISVIARGACTPTLATQAALSEALGAKASKLFPKQ